mgnify:CR=1 FL=1
MDETRHCQKCGRELASCNNGKFCRHCRQKTWNSLKKLGEGIFVVVGVVGGVVGVVGGVDAVFKRLLPIVRNLRK